MKSIITELKLDNKHPDSDGLTPGRLSLILQLGL